MNFTFRLLLKNLSVFSSTLKSIVDSIVENNITCYLNWIMNEWLLSTIVYDRNKLPRKPCELWNIKNQYNITFKYEI